MNQDKHSSSFLNGLGSTLLLCLSSLLCFIPILFIGLLKLFPKLDWQSLCARGVDRIASFWTSINNLYIEKRLRIHWEISGLKDFNPKDWYLVVANHQSWLDVVVLQRLFNRKIPTLKFFVKDQLKWLPLLGFAWWAMGCPFMKRYSKDYLLKKPHKKGKDLQATEKALRLLKKKPASIMNFIEGTRYNPKKSQQQESPYQHLLKPKAGGISFVISAMGQRINSLLDVSIIYPEEQFSLWDFLCRRMKAIKVHVRSLPIPQQFSEACLINNEAIQTEFKAWLNRCWQEKDQLIASLKFDKSLDTTQQSA